MLLARSDVQSPMSARQRNLLDEVLQDLVNLGPQGPSQITFTSPFVSWHIRLGALPILRVYFQSARNAFKYTPAGKCDPFWPNSSGLSCQCNEIPAWGAPEYLPFIFQRFGDPTGSGLDG